MKYSTVYWFVINFSCHSRYKRFQKAFMLAVDIGAADLFMVCTFFFK